jgi:hypothetical protein
MASLNAHRLQYARPFDFLSRKHYFQYFGASPPFFMGLSSSYSIIMLSIAYRITAPRTYQNQILIRLPMFDTLLATLEERLRTDFQTAITELIATARTQLESALAEVARERAEGVAMIATQKEELHLEIEAMQRHQEKQEGRVELNIGGYRFQTSVQTLRRLPHTFFDAYFSGRYSQDVCNDGSIFVDRDGEHFGHILEYMRDGVVSVAEPGARPSVSLLRVLKREFGFYCIELSRETADLNQQEAAYVMGGVTGITTTSTTESMERYDAMTGQWSAAPPMGTARRDFGTCVLAGEVYVVGGQHRENRSYLSSAEKFSPSSNTWSAMEAMPDARTSHAAVAVGSAIYVLGGYRDAHLASVLKFDSTQGTWSQVAPMPRATVCFSACAIGSDIFTSGGHNAEGIQTSVYKLDTVLNEWSTVAPLPIACGGHSMSECDGLLYIVGAGEGHRSTFRYDPATDVWETLAPTSIQRNFSCSFVLGQCLYVAGGIDSHSSVERYDVVKDTWTAVAALLQYRCGFGAVTIGSASLAEDQNLFDSLIAQASK